MFVKYKASAGIIAKYFLFKIPLAVYQIIPAAVLLSTLLTVGIMSKNNEITAMKACGISIYKISGPLLLIALVITGFTFISSEYITPYTNTKVESIKNSVKNMRPKYFVKHDKIWYTGRGLIYNIDYFDNKTNELYGITIFNFDDNFNIVKRTDAKTALFKDNGWVLNDIITRDFSYKKGKLGINEVKETGEKKVLFIEPPKTFKEVRKKTREMSYNELKRFISKIKHEGYGATEYEVDLYAKISIPFISVVMTIIGIPFALKRRRAGSIAVGTGISIVIGFCYWIMLSFALSLGHAGVLPPVVAAWISLIIFLLIGAYMFSTIRQ
jgi:lipopolysaccharide export system permease protein